MISRGCNLPESLDSQSWGSHGTERENVWNGASGVAWALSSRTAFLGQGHLGTRGDIPGLPPGVLGDRSEGGQKRRTGKSN
jgi:hypothetical protein